MAGVAQVVEHRKCRYAKGAGSNPCPRPPLVVPERSKGTGCKPVGLTAPRRFESYPPDIAQGRGLCALVRTSGFLREGGDRAPFPSSPRDLPKHRSLAIAFSSQSEFTQATGWYLIQQRGYVLVDKVIPTLVGSKRW